MHFEFEHLGTVSRFELEPGQHLLGGGDADGVRLEGLPAGLLTLHVDAQRLLVEAAQPVTVNGVRIPTGVARLLLPGEQLALPGQMLLRALPDAGHSRSVGTLAVLCGLLGDGGSASRSRAASLTCLTGLDLGRRFALAEDAMDIGRGAHAPIRLRDRAMSRAHARLRRTPQGFCVEDLGSPNGLYLNGHRLRGEAPLEDGDVLELGQTLLRYEAPLDAPGAALPAAGAAPPLPATPVDTGPAQPPRPAARRRGLERWVIALGAMLAAAGLLATCALCSDSGAARALRAPAAPALRAR